MKWCRSILLLLISATSGYCGESGTITLETVRALVARNETLLNPIRMAYTVKKSRTGERPQATVGSRRGRSYSHFNCIWAQAGDKHYAREDYFYGPNEPAHSSEKVFEPECVTEGKLPDLMEGTIRPRDNYDWYAVLVAKLGLRPFEGHYTLSQILVPKYAVLHKKTEMIDGRETYVVDARRPVIPAYFARIWTDRQRGIPLRIWYYDKHPNWSDARVSSEINDIKHHRLPNGGWIPVEGVRSINFSDDYISFEHITVDINSITTRPEDIPEYPFKIDFPEGARIYNAVSGLTSVKGQPLKTYEQVVGQGDTYVAGVVTDEKGTSVPGVVVGPGAVRTKQSDGSFSLKLIQVFDRPCAITDAKGRFAIELEDEGEYELWVFPEDFVDMRVRDVPLGKHDLRITLRKGGTVAGRVVRLMTGRKVPVVNAEVTAEEAGRATLRRHRMRTKTDSEGRFQFKYLDVLMPKRRTDKSEPLQYVPRTWQITCGSTSETVLFERGRKAQNVELVLKPDLQEAIPLIGRALPDFEGIRINLPPSQTKNKMMLICFFDMNQRPSRNCIVQLAKQAEQLKQEGVAVVTVQASKLDEKKLNEWVKKNNISFSVGMIQGDAEKIRFAWGVKSLPWLILTDNKHIIRAERFAVSELNGRLDKILDNAP